MFKKIFAAFIIVLLTTVLIACVSTTSMNTTNNSTTNNNTLSTTISNTLTTTTNLTTATTTITTTTMTPTTTTMLTSETGVLVYVGSTLVNGEVASPYSVNVGTASGFYNITYNLKSGSELPPGLTLSPEGIISGTPTTSGTFNFIIIAMSDDTADVVEASFTIEIDEEVIGPQTYIFEAEYVDFTGISGSGWSNTQTEWGMVLGDGETTPVSNGMYVAYFTPPYATLKFPFTSDAAGTGDLIFSMVTEYVKDFNGTDAMLLEPSIMTLKINDVEIDYTVFVFGENQPTMDFQEYIFLQDFDILEGENMIEITILPNDYFPGRTGGGPNVDYMKIESELNLIMDLYCSTIDEVKLLRGY